MSCSSKLIEPKEGILGTSNLYSTWSHAIMTKLIITNITIYIHLINLVFIKHSVLFVLCLVAQSCPLCDPMDWSPPGSSVYGDFPGKNTGVCCHALLQGIFLTQGLNSDLLHCRQILYQLSYNDILHIYAYNIYIYISAIKKNVTLPVWHNTEGPRRYYAKWNNFR